MRGEVIKLGGRRLRVVAIDEAALDTRFSDGDHDEVGEIVILAATSEWDLFLRGDAQASLKKSQDVRAAKRKRAA